MSPSVEEPPVLVTGGSGYLAGFVIAHLLSAGRPVRATLRDLGREGAVRAVGRPRDVIPDYLVALQR